MLKKVMSVSGWLRAGLFGAVSTVFALAGCTGSANLPSPAPVPGTLSVTATAVTIAQAAGTVSISVGRGTGSGGAVSLAYTTVDGTALAGTDYTKASGTLTWSDGDASVKSFSVPLATVPGFTGTRTFSITLSGATGGATITAGSETVSITGTGAPGTIALTASSMTVTQASGSATASVTRSGGSSGAVSVSYRTTDGTAAAGTDYAAATGTLSWADGDTSAKTISVPVTTTPGFTGTRTFTVSLSGATNGASLGTASDVVSITGSGAPQPGTLALAASTVSVGQATGSVVLPVNRTGGSSGAVSVSYTTADGTALAGTDYTAASGTLSWTSGDTAAKTVTISVATTPGFAGTKTFALALSGATGGATLGTASETVSVTGSLLPPANYFSFTFPTGTWKLQLPIDQFGGTGGLNNIQYPSIEEKTSDLTGGFVDSYFYADTATYAGATNHIVFVAPSNGASTSPGSGSDHTRSELRELYTGTGADSNSDWTSVIGGTLTANCVVQAVSVDSDEATIAQIHNQSYVFMLLMYRPAQKDIAVDIYSSLASSTHSRTAIVTGVNVGDAVSYSIAYKDSTINVTVNGTTKSYAIDPTWAGTPMYFKLGAYHAALNIGNPVGDKTQVAFSSFVVTH